MTDNVRPLGAVLAYDQVAMLAEAVDDVERIRIAHENRLRSFDQAGLDDAATRQLGLVVAQMVEMEKGTTKALERSLKRLPLGPWVKATTGIGAKQGARLLGALGDPYWNTLDDRPRRGPAELWAYCGLHTTDSGTGYSVAVKRKRGERANWSAEAKMRIYLISCSCIKAATSPYRKVYDDRRAATEERVHQAVCVRCGPAGHPAQVGSSWSKGHQHADALRIVSKRILRDLYRESKRIHDETSGDQIQSDTRGGSVAGTNDDRPDEGPSPLAKGA